MYVFDTHASKNGWARRSGDQHLLPRSDLLIATRSKGTENLLTQFLSSCGIAVNCCINEISESSPPIKDANLAVLLLDYAFIEDRYDAQSLCRLAHGSIDLRVLVVGGEISHSEKRRLLNAGARGHLRLSKDLQFLVRAIREITSGGLWFERSILAEVILQTARGRYSEFKDHSSEFICNALTPRERIVATCVGQALKNREIAAKLKISEKTVKLHLTRVYRKLKVTSRVQLGLMLTSRKAS